MHERATPAVVLGGSLNALGVARTLWRSGVAVDVLSDGRSDSPVRFSRACRSYLSAHPGDDPSESWMRWLRDRASAAVLLPCSDEGVEFVARNRSTLEALGYLPVEANDQALLDMLDKSRTYELARAANVPTPRTLTVSDPASLGALDIPFPCAVKPIRSHAFAREFEPSAKAAVLSSAAQARRILAPILDSGHAMLLTEVIPGRDDEFRSYYTYLDERGEPLLHFTKRKLRQYPTHFGLGTYHVTEWNPEVARLGLQFARGAGLRGVVNVEFKRDGRDGALKLIECNPRFTAADEQVRVAGIDLALLAYNRLVGRPPPPLDRFRNGIGLWSPLQDVRALVEYRRQGELTAAEWMATLLRRQVVPVFSWQDPKPSAMVWRGRAHMVARNVIRFATRSARPSVSRRPDPYADVGP